MLAENQYYSQDYYDATDYEQNLANSFHILTHSIRRAMEMPAEALSIFSLESDFN
jgi:hypothetical protein